MKKYLSLLILLFVILLTGCTYRNLLENNHNEKLLNTYRNPKLLFQINYPQNWVITDNGKNSSFYGEKYSFIIANYPAPPEGWSIGNQPPEDTIMYFMEVGPKEENDNDYYKDEKEVALKEEINVDVGRKNKLKLLTYDYNSKDGVHDLGLPTAIAYYYGDYYLYTFMIGGSGPRSQTEIEIFKQIIKTFKEIR